MLTNYIRRYPISILIAMVITVISLIPVPEIKEVEDVPLMDKWVHMLMYGILTFCIWFEYRRSHGKWNWARLILFGVVAPIVMSGVVELMQAFLTTCRSGEWLDFLANSIGVAIGTLLGASLKIKMLGLK